MSIFCQITKIRFLLLWGLLRSYWNSKDHHDLTGTQKINKCSVLFWLALQILVEFQKISQFYSNSKDQIPVLCSSGRHCRSYWNFKRFHNFTGTQKIKPKCSVLSLCTAVSLVDSVSRDVSNWLFLLFWTLFPEMFPLVI